MMILGDKDNCPSPYDENNSTFSNATGLYCNATWDSFYCWPTTPAGTIVYKPCPVSHFTYKDSKAFRICQPDGRWAKNGWTNYSACLGCLDPESPFYGSCQGLKNPEEVQKNQLHITRIIRDITFFGSIISLIFLSITFFIFSYFKTLKCVRITIHRNLVLAFILRSLMTIAIAEPAVMERSTSYRQIEWLCKLIISINIYGTLASVAWMFNEGLYLHNRLAISVFTSENSPFWIFYFLGWVLPLAFTSLWAIFINKNNPVHCWNNYSSSHYIWIIGVPMIVALLVNLCFLINIIRILILKLKASNFVETTNFKKTIKATIILFPLLGITNLLFFFNPKDKGIFENMYLIVNAILQNSQGLFVSILYCFLNGEVRTAIKKRYRTYRFSRIDSLKHRRSTSNIYFQQNVGNLGQHAERSPGTGNTYTTSRTLSSPLLPYIDRLKRPSRNLSTLIGLLRDSQHFTFKDCNHCSQVKNGSGRNSSKLQTPTLLNGAHKGRTYSQGVYLDVPGTSHQFENTSPSITKNVPSGVAENQTVPYRRRLPYSQGSRDQTLHQKRVGRFKKRLKQLVLTPLVGSTRTNDTPVINNLSSSPPTQSLLAPDQHDKVASASSKEDSDRGKHESGFIRLSNAFCFHNATFRKSLTGSNDSSSSPQSWKRRRNSSFSTFHPAGVRSRGTSLLVPRGAPEISEVIEEDEATETSKKLQTYDQNPKVKYFSQEHLNVQERERAPFSLIAYIPPNTKPIYKSTPLLYLTDHSQTKPQIVDNNLSQHPDLETDKGNNCIDCHPILLNIEPNDQPSKKCINVTKTKCDDQKFCKKSFLDFFTKKENPAII